MAATGSNRTGATARSAWEAALVDVEHQATRSDTPDHGQTGHLIAQALRAGADITRSGGLACEKACWVMTMQTGVQPQAPAASHSDSFTRVRQAAPRQPTATSARPREVRRGSRTQVDV